jgi:5-(carboxyamino)imidazole ribonucleotide mutase
MRDESSLKENKTEHQAKETDENDASSLIPPSSSLVSIIMGSKSDWETMQRADEVLERFGVPHECLVVSAHRTPLWMAEFAAGAEARGIEVIIAGAGGAAHLPGMVAAQTLLPVLGVPVKSKALKGMDSLLSIVQMPAGVPVGTLAIGEAGATNAALLAVAILANTRPPLREKLREFRRDQEQQVREATLK